MAKRPTSIRLSALADRQLEELAAQWGLNQTEVIGIAVDRLYQEEMMPELTLESIARENGAIRFNYDAYLAEIGRVGAKQARKRLLALLTQHVTQIAADLSLGQQERQIELAANAYFAAAGQQPYRKDEWHK